MKNIKKNRKSKKILKQFITIIVIVALLFLGRYTKLEKENNSLENIQDEFTQTNTINNTESNINADTNIRIDNIPPYSGNMVISINNDVPYFEDKDIKTEDFEYYSNLDELNRAQVAFANICKYTMPSEGEKRSSLSYKPTGWVQYLYGENNSKHLYERCHLIAWQLGNENNNKRNLITGTSQLNSAMIEYENIVANWIKLKNQQDKNYHVLYRVTPIYKDDNKIATGVEIEAKSVEEEGISFNKFIYNVQDNFEIDYYTGKAKLKE